VNYPWLKPGASRFVESTCPATTISAAMRHRGLLSAGVTSGGSRPRELPSLLRSRGAFKRGKVRRLRWARLYPLPEGRGFSREPVDKRERFFLFRRHPSFYYARTPVCKLSFPAPIQPLPFGRGLLGGEVKRRNVRQFVLSVVAPPA